MCNDIAETFLCDILDGTDQKLSERLRKSTKDEFETFSVSRWVAGELIELIDKHPFSPIEDIIGEFAFNMACFRASAEDTPSEIVFAKATEIALEWLQQIKYYCEERSSDLTAEYRYKISTSD